MQNLKTPALAGIGHLPSRSGRLPSASEVDTARTADADAAGRAVESSRAGNRDLFWGVGGKGLAPDPAATSTRSSRSSSGGFSRGYTVTGPGKREWSVKFPPEAPTEVVASRILWGIGYHQPPIYYVRRWQADKATQPNPQLPARFREKKPDLHGLEADGIWSYYQNPFVGTRS